jgi:hypothetical protein
MGNETESEDDSILQLKIFFDPKNSWTDIHVTHYNYNVISRPIDIV